MALALVIEILSKKNFCGSIGYYAMGSEIGNDGKNVLFGTSKRRIREIY